MISTNEYIATDTVTSYKMISVNFTDERAISESEYNLILDAVNSDYGSGIISILYFEADVSTIVNIIITTSTVVTPIVDGSWYGLTTINVAEASGTTINQSTTAISDNIGFYKSDISKLVFVGPANISVGDGVDPDIVTVDITETVTASDKTKIDAVTSTFDYLSKFGNISVDGVILETGRIVTTSTSTIVTLPVAMGDSNYIAVASIEGPIYSISGISVPVKIGAKTPGTVEIIRSGNMTGNLIVDYFIVGQKA